MGCRWGRRGRYDKPAPARTARSAPPPARQSPLRRQAPRPKRVFCESSRIPPSTRPLAGPFSAGAANAPRDAGLASWLPHAPLRTARPALEAPGHPSVGVGPEPQFLLADSAPATPTTKDEVEEHAQSSRPAHGPPPINQPQDRVD